MLTMAALLAIQLLASAASLPSSGAAAADPCLPQAEPPAIAPLPDSQVQADAYEDIELAGFHVRLHRRFRGDLAPRWWWIEPAMIYDLETVTRVLPAHAVAALKSVPIWVTPALTPREGFTAHGLCYHPSPEWLQQAGLGAARAKAVEVCNAEEYLRQRPVQPMQLLHELAHAYHDILGYDNAEIAAAWGHARTVESYQKVRRAGADPSARFSAYALTNDREYFAELSEAYFGRNDFEPFIRSQLQTFDPEGFRMIEHAWFGPLPPRADHADDDRPAGAATPSGGAR